MKAKQTLKLTKRQIQVALVALESKRNTYKKHQKEFDDVFLKKGLGHQISEISELIELVSSALGED